MWDLQEEIEFRESLIEAVISQANHADGMLSRLELGNFNFAGTEVRLIDPQGGIWNPSASWTLTDPFRGTLSINTTLTGVYEDQEIKGGLWRYDYQSGGADGKNLKLRRAWELQLPLLWFRQQAPSGRYVPYKVFVIEEHPDDNYCLISPELSLSVAYNSGSEIEKRYAERLIKQRLHQPAFRARVLNAYATRCAICNLQFGELLDGAHITPDSDPDTSVSVTNGICMCKIHHAAYDRLLLGIDEEFKISIRADILNISDGPILKYGLQEMNDREIILPSSEEMWPDRSRLGRRHEKFLDQAV